MYIAGTTDGPYSYLNINCRLNLLAGYESSNGWLYYSSTTASYPNINCADPRLSLFWSNLHLQYKPTSKPDLEIIALLQLSYIILLLICIRYYYYFMTLSTSEQLSLCSCFRSPIVLSLQLVGWLWSIDWAPRPGRWKHQEINLEKASSGRWKHRDIILFPSGYPYVSPWL